MLPFVSLKPRDTQSPSVAPVCLWLVCGLGMILSLISCETQAPKPLDDIQALILLSSVQVDEGKAVSPRPATILNQAEVTAAEGKAPQFRYNWSSPLILSPHDSKTLYLGSNRLVRSTDRGETWEIISPDLSTNDPELTDRTTHRPGGQQPPCSAHATASVPGRFCPNNQAVNSPRLCP